MTDKRSKLYKIHNMLKLYEISERSDVICSKEKAISELQHLTATQRHQNGSVSSSTSSPYTSTTSSAIFKYGLSHFSSFP